MDALWIIIAGCLVAWVCALPGSLLMLRKQALLGDAISHAVLPGIFLAYYFSSGTHPVFLLPGAAFSGWIAAQAIAWLSRNKRLSSDAATGLIFTFLFAIGVICISAFAHQTDLDQDCVLFGDILWVPLDRWISDSGQDLGPVAVWILAFALVCFILILILFFRQWKITTLDEVFAQSSGFKTGFWQSLLMGLVSISAVVSFRSVGVVLVIAFLAVPAATAALYVKSLTRQLTDSCFWGTLSVLSGWYIGSAWNLSVSGTMAFMTGVWFCIVFILSRLRLKHNA